MQRADARVQSAECTSGKCRITLEQSDPARTTIRHLNFLLIRLQPAPAQKETAIEGALQLVQPICSAHEIRISEMGLNGCSLSPSDVFGMKKWRGMVNMERPRGKREREKMRAGGKEMGGRVGCRGRIVGGNDWVKRAKGDRLRVPTSPCQAGVSDPRTQPSCQKLEPSQTGKDEMDLWQARRGDQGKPRKVEPADTHLSA